MTNTIKDKFNNFKIGSDYMFSVEGNKEVYTIYSGKLKQFIREIIVNKLLSERFRRSVEMEGHSIDGGYFSYEGGVGDLPDSFIANVDWEEKMEKRIEEVKKQEKETKQRSREIRERVEKEGCPPENHSFHFSRWEGDNLVERKNLFLNYNPFEMEVDDNPSKIQEITDKENKKVENNQTLTNSKKENGIKQGKFSDTDSKDTNNGSFAPLLVGGIVLVGLVSFLVTKSIKKIKKQS